MWERRGRPPCRDGNEGRLLGEWREVATERSAAKGSSNSQRVETANMSGAMEEKRGDGRKFKMGAF